MTTREALKRVRRQKKSEALKFLAELRHKARKDTLTRICLNGYAVSIGEVLGVSADRVSVYPFKH